MSRPRQFAVEGPPGVGKTAFARLLAEALGARTICEPENPFGAASNVGHKRNFQAQLAQLLGRYQQRPLFGQEDLFHFGSVSDYLFQCDRLGALAFLSRDELLLYDRVYALLMREQQRPDLVVCLQARTDVLAARLRRRDGVEPQRVELERAAQAYAEFFFHYEESPLLVVNTSEIDFVERRADLDELVAVIQRTKGGVHHISPLGSR